MDHGGKRDNAGRPPTFKNELEELVCFLLVEERYADLQFAQQQDEKDPFESESARNVALLRAKLHKMPQSKREQIHDAVKRGVPVEKIIEAKDWHDLQQDLPICRIVGRKRLYRAGRTRRDVFEEVAEGLRGHLKRPQITWRGVKEVYQRIKRERRA